MGTSKNPVRAELVEAHLAYPINLVQPEQPFDKLRANGNEVFINSYH